MSFTLLKRYMQNAIANYCLQNNVIKFSPVPLVTKHLHTSDKQCELMDFFDIKKNWNENNIRVGRGWRLDELRIKSNTDLHKLWYVLLKERNMLYTMEHECNEQMRTFANPERIDKVQESMNNIEITIRERNTAYYTLETGETGERPVEEVKSLIGLPEKYQKQEYYIPKFMNTRWVRTYLEHGLHNNLAIKKFYRLYREKLYNVERKAKNRDFNQVQHLLKRFPNMDMEKLKAEYPNVDIEKAQRSKKARGHFFPKY